MVFICSLIKIPITLKNRGALGCDCSRRPAWLPGRGARVSFGVRQQLQRVRARLTAHVARVLAPHALAGRARAIVPLVAISQYIVIKVRYNIKSRGSHRCRRGSVYRYTRSITPIFYNIVCRSSHQKDKPRYSTEVSSPWSHNCPGVVNWVTYKLPINYNTKFPNRYRWAPQCSRHNTVIYFHTVCSDKNNLNISLCSL